MVNNFADFASDTHRHNLLTSALSSSVAISLWATKSCREKTCKCEYTQTWNEWHFPLFTLLFVLAIAALRLVRELKYFDHAIGWNTGVSQDGRI